jgi:oligopeptide transport system substrate-binding protein
MGCATLSIRRTAELLRPILAFMAAAVLLGACSGGGGRPACPAGKLCMNIGNGAEPGTLDPAKSTGTWEANILRDLFEGLVTESASAEPIPGAAVSWTTSPDGLVWTFKLRKGAVWSDGYPVTADDFVFALRRVQDPATASEYSYLLNVIKGAKAINEGKAKPETLGVRAVDPLTLEIRLEHPAPYLLGLLTHSTAYPVPAHLIRRVGDAWIRPGNLVTNGPYTLAYWKLGDRIRTVKNPRYYAADQVCIDEVYYFPVSDYIAAERRVRRGEFDMSNRITANRVAYLRQPDQIPAYVHTHVWLTNAYLMFNAASPKFRDLRVRKAVALAIDREFIVNKARRAGETPAYSFVPPGIANYPRPARVRWADWPFEKRQAEARRLLREAGYTPEHPLRFEITHRGIDHGVLWPAIQADLKAVGVEVSLVGAESQVAYAAFRARDFEVGDVGWVADFNDPINFLELNRSSTGAQNYGDYKNPAYDALLQEADQERDLARRAELLRQAEQLLLDDLPVVPLFFSPSTNLVNPDVTGWVDNVQDFHRKRWMCFRNADQRRQPPA